MKYLLPIFFAQIRAQEYLPTAKDLRRLKLVPLEQFTFEHKASVNTFIEKGHVIKTSIS